MRYKKFEHVQSRWDRIRVDDTRRENVNFKQNENILNSHDLGFLIYAKQR